MKVFTKKMFAVVAGISMLVLNLSAAAEAPISREAIYEGQTPDEIAGVVSAHFALEGRDVVNLSGLVSAKCGAGATATQRVISIPGGQMPIVRMIRGQAVVAPQIISSHNFELTMVRASVTKRQVKFEAQLVSMLTGETFCTGSAAIPVMFKRMEDYQRYIPASSLSDVDVAFNLKNNRLDRFYVSGFAACYSDNAGHTWGLPVVCKLDESELVESLVTKRSVSFTAVNESTSEYSSCEVNARYDRAKDSYRVSVSVHASLHGASGFENCNGSDTQRLMRDL